LIWVDWLSEARTLNTINEAAMAVVPLRIYGDPVLSTKAGVVAGLSKEVKATIRDLKESIRSHRGLGLAANQIGFQERVFVFDDGKGLKAVINPRVVKSEGSALAEEGCLSLPGIFLELERASLVELEYRDENWEEKRLKAEGLAARIIQHEVDHLDGVVIADRAGYLSRKLITRKLRHLAEERGQE